MVSNSFNVHYYERYVNLADSWMASGTDRLNFLEHAFDLRTIQREKFCADGLLD